MKTCPPPPAPRESASLTLIDANNIRRSALDSLARAYHDRIWAQCMLAEAIRITRKVRASGNKLDKGRSI